MLSFAFPRRVLAAAIAVGAIAVFGVAGAGAAGSKIFNPQNLVTDSSTFTAVVTDAALLNPWGLSATTTSPWWVANNGSNTSTLYNGAGTKSTTVVAVPGGPT